MTERNPQITQTVPASGLTGTVSVPGDKSISHRALMLGALAVGETRIHGLLEGEDVLHTADAMRALGASVERREDDGRPIWIVHGRGVGGLIEPDGVLDMGNSGTSARLLSGLLAAHAMTSVLTGDESLRRRPMDRIVSPLSRMGASFHSRSGNRLPMTITGTGDPVPLVYESPVASAQVKSAVLLAGLQARGATTVIEPSTTRDHTERMLRHFGAEVVTKSEGDRPSAHAVTVTGLPELSGQTVVVPGDPSSAAFLIVAALITKGSSLVLTGVGLNPLRTGLIDTLREMDADIEVSNRREEAGEPVGDLAVTSSALRGVVVPANRAPSMIDEYPILAIAAACAEGETRMEGLQELRVKESDRLAAVAQGLSACGVTATVAGDDLTVCGCGGPVPGGAVIPARMDHRIAMAFLVLGLAAEQPIGVDDTAAIGTSYPDFISHMTGLGTRFETVNRANTGHL